MPADDITITIPGEVTVTPGAELEFYISGLLSGFMEPTDPRRERVRDTIREFVGRIEAGERERIKVYVTDALGIAEWEMVEDLMGHGQHG